MRDNGIWLRRRIGNMGNGQPQHCGADRYMLSYIRSLYAADSILHLLDGTFGHRFPEILRHIRCDIRSYVGCSVFYLEKEDTRVKRQAETISNKPSPVHSGRGFLFAASFYIVRSHDCASTVSYIFTTSCLPQYIIVRLDEGQIAGCDVRLRSDLLVFVINA